MSNRAHEFVRQATAVTIAAADTDVTANAAATMTSNLMTYTCANDVTEAADVMTHANNLTRRPTRLRPGSKWRVAQKMIGLMDSNRASNEKQDMADIVKMFQRLNAKKIFDNLNAAGALSDINTDVLNMPTAATKFEGLEAARAKLADTRYDSVDIERSFTEQLDDHRKDTKGTCTRARHSQTVKSVI